MKKQNEKEGFEVVMVTRNVLRFAYAGELMRFMREKAKLTQGQLAKKVGTRQPSIARLERKSSNPSFDMMIKISKACGFSMEAPFFVCKKCGKNIRECNCEKVIKPNK